MKYKVTYYIGNKKLYHVEVEDYPTDSKPVYNAMTNGLTNPDVTSFRVTKLIRNT